jgi:hypothetical protein
MRGRGGGIELARIQPSKPEYNRYMDLKRVVQDSSNVNAGRQLLGRIRAYLYIGVAALLAVVYAWNHYR